MRKKIIFYQSNFCQMGGVETMAYNWCWWLRNFFDVVVLYCGGDATRIGKMKKLVQMEKYDEDKEYECDIFIRNSVWGKIPTNIKAKRMIEMRHANYKFLLDKGLLYEQYKDMGIKEIVGCGEFVSKMSNEVLHDNPTTIKNILMPTRETHKVLHFIYCGRIDAHKGWNRILKFVDMLRSARIKFVIDIFTNAYNYKSPYEEIRIWHYRDDIWDYIADADYTILFSDSEGLPYQIQESLQYKTPCIVTNVGGCTELIKDGVNGYVVPLDMNFDVKKLLNIPKCEEYDNHSLEDWLKYLGYEGKIDKKEIIKNAKEEESSMVRVRALINFDDVEMGRIKRIAHVSEWECSKERADYLLEHKAIEIIEEPNFEIKEDVVGAVATAIKEQAKEDNKKVEEVVDELVEEFKEEPVKPKKKTTKKK